MGVLYNVGIDGGPRCQESLLVFLFWIMALMATHTAMTMSMNTQKIQSAALNPNMLPSPRSGGASAIQ